MAEAGTYSSLLDPGIDFSCTMEYRDDGGGLIDISGLQFRFILKRRIDNSTAWDITNGSFSRPSTGKITFGKTAAEVRALMQGTYTGSLFVSGTAIIDGSSRTFSNDEWTTGTFQR